MWKIVAIIVVVSAIAVLAAPVSNFLSGKPCTVASGQDFVAREMPLGVSYESALFTLDAESFPYTEITRESCGNFYIYPEFECKGGPALYVTLNTKICTLNPLHVPSLQAFLAFGSDNKLAGSVVLPIGGD